MNIPDSMPDKPLKQGNAQDLLRTLVGICNESALTRAEIIGVLETAKMSLFDMWQDEDDE